MRTVYVGCVIVLALGMQATAAQPAVVQPRHATLFGWEERMRRALLDRSRGYGGRYYERGLLRTVTRQMDYEYDLDLFTYRFTPFDDYLWRHAENAFYSFAGSIDYGAFATASRLKSRVAIGSQGRFDVVGVQQEDLRAQRFFLKAGYAHALGDRHTLGLHHTLGAEKSDLDAILSYRFGDAASGWVEAEVALLDWPSNIVHHLITSSDRDFDVVQRYERAPRLWTVRAVAPSHLSLRAEFVASVQPVSRAAVARQAAPDSGFVNAEAAHYAGVLVEYTRARWTAGLTAQRTFARMRRTPDDPSDYALNFGNRERTNRLGLYVARAGRRVAFEQWGWIEQNRDQLFGRAVPDGWSPFNFREVRFWSKSRVRMGRLADGLWGGLELNIDHRNVLGKREGNTINRPFRRNYPDQVTGDNQRLTFMGGYRYSPSVRITVGVSFDIDGDLYSGWGIPSPHRDAPARFDGGFLRLALDW